MQQTSSASACRTARSVILRLFAFLVVAIGLSEFGGHVKAFSLVGPFTDWMDLEKGYRKPGDIGGPMNIGEGYRWNVPVITYGFDRAFLDYFGSNGVAAVEQAITLLNNVPASSQVSLQGSRTDCWRRNLVAQSWDLLDLKSQALAILLEQMGLADSLRYVFCVRDFQSTGATNYSFYTIERSFDPFTALPSHYVNNTLFTYAVAQYGTAPTSTNVFCEALTFSTDPTGPPYEPVTGNELSSPFGMFVTNLTRDDIGGLAYLLSGNQVWCEDLLPDIHLVDTNAGPLVQTAYRPGVEKITFVRHPAGPLNGAFLPFTNRWTDVYLDFFAPGYQEVERVTTRPDILFSAEDLGALTGWTRTGTTNWANNAALNGSATAAGPGVIQPPITITLNSAGRFYLNFSTDGLSYPDELGAILIMGWGSFDGTTNLPTLYPAGQTPFTPTQVRLRLSLGTDSRSFQWTLAGFPFGRFFLQTATNLTNWATLATLTNSGAPFEYQFQAGTNETMRFFRTVPQR